MNELHLFAGAGGGILGGELLGHTCVCAVEIEPYPRKVLLQRQRDGILPRFPIWDDITTFDGNPWRGRVDVVCGGFPCQDISAAGKGAGITGERSGLWGEMARVIREVRPRFVFVENSPMLTSRGLGTVLGDMAAMGFDARWCVLGACDAGAPHKRERIWILADATMPNDKTCSSPEGHTEGPQREFGGGCRSKDALADAARIQQGREEQRPERKRAGAGSESAADVADAASLGQSGQGQSVGPIYSTKNQDGKTDQPINASEGDCTWWITEPDVGRVAHGVASRVDRLKAIGNGQVPAVAALAWKILTGKESKT
jgi:DNA (cytosine-5)-methyltransferase 1